MKIYIKPDFFYQSLALLPVFTCTIIYGCNIQWLMNAAFYLTQPEHVPSATVAQCSYLASIHEVGRLLFSVPSGLLIDKFGRQKAILALGFLNFLAWTTIIFLEDITLIYGIRFIMGISSALCMCSYAAIIGEISSSKYRGIFNTINVLTVTLSGVFQSTLSVLFSMYTAVAIGPAIVALMFFATTYFLKESPYYLTSKGAFDQAKKNIRALNPSLTDVQIKDQFETLKTYINQENTARAAISSWQFVTTKSVRKSIICAILVNVLLQFCGSPALAAYITIVLPATSLVPNSFYPLMSLTFCLIGQIFFIFVVEKFARRFLFLISLFALILPLSSCLINCYFELYKESEFMKWLLIAGYLFILVMNGTFLLPLTETLTSELFSYSIKGKAYGVVFIFRSTALIISFELFGVFTSSVGVYGNFAFYTISALCLMIVVYFIIPETRGKSLAEIQKELSAEAALSQTKITNKPVAILDEDFQLQPRTPTLKNIDKN